MNAANAERHERRGVPCKFWKRVVSRTEYNGRGAGLENSLVVTGIRVMLLTCNSLRIASANSYQVASPEFAR